MNNNVKMIIGCIITVAGFLVIVGCAIASIIISIQNPDMTDMRQLIEYPEPTIVAIIALIFVGIGKNMMEWRQ